MAVVRGGRADEAATRRCRLSEPLPEMPPPTVRRLHMPQPVLRYAAVLVLIVSGISPSASNTSPASVDRRAPNALEGPCTVRRCSRLHGDGVSWGRGTAAHARWQGPGQVQPPMLTPRDLECMRLPGHQAARRGWRCAERILSCVSCCTTSRQDDAGRSWMVCVPAECGGA